MSDSLPEQEGAKPATRPKRPRWLGPVVALASVFLFLVIAEVVLRFAPVPDPYAQYKPEKEPSTYINSQHERNLRIQTEVEEGLPGLSGKHTFATNNMGFRGDDLVRPKPKGEFRAFVVGGSTTECFYLDDSQTIAGVLQKSLRASSPADRVIDVQNAGKDGDKSYDHVAMVVHRLVFLEPDLIVVFAGINDLLASIAEKDYLHYPAAVATKVKLPLLVKMTLSEFQLPRRVYYLLPKSDRSLLEEITLTSRYRKLVELRKSKPVLDALPRTEPDAYAKNLVTLAGACKAHGIPLVFMTQPTTWTSKVDPHVDDWQWMLMTSKGVYKPEAMDAALESLNDAMRRVGTEQGVPVYDLARVLPKSLDFMYDDCHLNVKGAETVGSGLAAWLVEKKLAPSR